MARVLQFIFRNFMSSFPLLRRVMDRSLIGYLVC